MVRPLMMSSLLPWRITTAVLACLSGTLLACSSEAPSQPVLVSLRIFPANPVVQTGTSTPLTATGIFSDSSRQDLTESVSWNSSAPRIVSISNEAGSRGLITGVAYGTAMIRAIHEDSGEIAEALAAVPSPPPELSAVQPAKGPRTGGTLITLSGKWFEPGITVTIGGAPASGLRIVNATTATAMTPPGAVGPQDVVVTGTLGSATLPGGFTYRGAPTLTRVQPSSGAVHGGTSITLHGTDLTPETTVTVGGAPLLNLNFIDDTTMTGTTPPGTVGPKDLVAANSLGLATLPGGFSYEEVWRPSNTGMDSGYVKSLVRHPQSPVVLYAGTVRGGVFKSTDAGLSWTFSNQGLTSLTIQGLVIDPASPTTLYAATDLGLFKTTDSGASWSLASRALESESFTALVLDPAIPTTLYAGTVNRGILKTVDGGATWNAVNTGLSSLVIRSLALDPSNAQVLYAGSANGAIFKTTNGGQSWSPARTGVPDTARDIQALAVDPNAPDTLYAAGNNGVYTSSDGGANWASASTGLGRFPLSLLLVAGTPTTLYAGTVDGVFKSTTGGTSWSSASTGLPALPVRAILAEPSNPSILYAGIQDGGVFKTTNGAASWSLSKRGMSNTEIFSITFSPSAPDMAYVGTRDGIFKTVDSGERWTDVSQGLPSRQVYSTAVHPTDPAIVYAGAWEGLHKTVNGGESWVSVLPQTSSGFHALAIHPTSHETIYAGTSQRLFKSVDGGSSWTQLTQGLPSSMWVFSIVFSSQNPSTVFMAASGKVYRSTDGGAQWVEIGAGLPADTGRQQLWVVPGTTETLYVASANRGLFKTVNGGGSWEQLFSNNASALLIHPQDPRTMYVGPISSTQPLELSRDGGRTWAPVSQPFFTSVQVLTMKPGDPRTILAGTWGRGIYKTTTGGQ